MPNLNVTYNFTNGNVAEAGQVNQNFEDVEVFTNTQVVRVDGSVQAPTIAIADAAVTSPKLAPPTLVTKSSSTSLIASDANCTLLCGSGSVMTLTVPAASSVAFANGTVITVVNYGSAMVTIAGNTVGTTVNVNSSNGKRLRTQYAVASLVKVSDTEWLLTGDTIV